AGVDFETEYTDEGELQVDVSYIPEEKKQELAETIIDDQKESLDRWFDYFTSEDSNSFPMWAKYWAFTGMTKLGTYDKEEGSFDTRSKGTVAPFPDLNREALARAVDYMVGKYSEEYLNLQQDKKELKNKIDRLDSYRRLTQKIEEKQDELPKQALEGMQRNLEDYQEEFGEDVDFSNKESELTEKLQNLEQKEEEILQTQNLTEEEKQAFSTESLRKMYAKALKETVPTEKKELKRTEGKWVKFPQGADPSEYVPEDFDQPLLDSIQGHGTGWCTAGRNTAETQLEGGNFYVYYSETEEGDPETPRAAIRMEDNQIAEVRGIAEEQNLDPYITEVVDSKLDEFGEKGKEYKEKLEDTEKLNQIAEKHYSGQKLSKKELEFLYELNDSIEGFGYESDPRIEEIKEDRDTKEDMLTIFECSEEEIASSPDEIDENTKAYLGTLEKGVFDKVFQYDIEHIYTSFPEGKIEITENFEVEPTTLKEFKKKVKEYNKKVTDKSENITITRWAQDVMRQEDFKTLEDPQQVDLVRLDVSDLFGDERQHTLEEIYERAEELGLDLCPPEVGPNLRLEYTNQPDQEWLMIAHDSIEDSVRYSGGCSFLLNVRRRGSALMLRASDGGLDWDPVSRFVFAARK
ncbi:MAG: hypothetical protein ABEI53_02695, partial [Candidatus Magasanikbacteria bacterium]